jgi:hypothetical protein
VADIAEPEGAQRAGCGGDPSADLQRRIPSELVEPLEEVAEDLVVLVPEVGKRHGLDQRFLELDRAERPIGGAVRRRQQGGADVLDPLLSRTEGAAPLARDRTGAGDLPEHQPLQLVGGGCDVLVGGAVEDRDGGHEAPLARSGVLPEPLRKILEEASLVVLLSLLKLAVSFDHGGQRGGEVTHPTWRQPALQALTDPICGLLECRVSVLAKLALQVAPEDVEGRGRVGTDDQVLGQLNRQRGERVDRDDQMTAGLSLLEAGGEFQERRGV